MADCWALLSDVHGNLPALRRTLEQARAEGATRVAFLGDALGGSGDESCCRLLMSEAEVSVFGNREMRLKLDLPGDVERWVRSLPATRVLDKYMLCHSSPAS